MSNNLPNETTSTQALLNLKTSFNNLNLNLESSLCFPKDVFYASNFDVDSFIAHYKREYPLERVRDDLSIFLKVLEMSMSDLINKDYPDFVNLSTNLVDLDKAINELKNPLLNIKNDVDTVKDSIDNEIELVMLKLNEKLMIEKRRIVLKLLMNWQRSLKVTTEMIDNSNNPNSQNISGDHVERIAFEFCQLKNSLSICSGETKDSIAQNNDVNKLSEILEKIMQDLFLTCLDIKKDENWSTNKCLKNDENLKQQLRHVLKSYALLSKQKQVEQIYTDYLVKPYLTKYINESYLESNILKLNGIYEKLLDFIDENSEFLKLSNEIKSVIYSQTNQSSNEFDFMISSLWSHIVQYLDFNLNSLIFSPSDPDLFHFNYTQSINFMHKFEFKCSQVDNEFKKKFIISQSYKQFIKKWPIQVYFQIRFQEIIFKFEQDLIDFTKLINRDDNHDNDIIHTDMFYLNISDSLLKLLEYCWLDSSKCFLKCLMSQFWKLSLQLISRYCSFFINKFQSNEHDDLINTSILLLSDVNKLRKEKLPNFFDGSIAPVIRSSNSSGSSNTSSNNNTETTQFIKEAFNLSLNNLNELEMILIDYVSKSQVEKCLNNLKNANDIPRLYRRTNRDIPKTASMYVSLTIDVIYEFKQMYETKNKYLIDKCIQSIIDSICLKYQSIASDLLESVKKMEDSLKRLQKVKKQNKNLTSTSSSMANLNSSSISDDDKIRLQLYLDVVEFGHLLDEKFNGYKGESNYDSLFKLVEDLALIANNSTTSTTIINNLNINNQNLLVNEENNELN